MFEKLLKQWANDENYETWSQDHAAVLRNLAKWLNSRNAKQGMHLDALWHSLVVSVLLNLFFIAVLSFIISGG